MTVLCIGGTGNVGQALVPLLLARGEPVRVVTRDEARIQSLPEGVEAFVGDLDDPGIIRDALDGVRAVYMALAMSPMEAYHGLTSVNVMTYRKPEHLVYLSSDISVHAPFMPSTGSKVGIEAAIRASGIPYTIMRPTFFFQNDYWVKDAIMNGAYAFPIGPTPVARVDVRDIADVAVAALLDGKAIDETVLLSSPDAPNGDETAAIWSEALGRPIAPPSQCRDVWAKIQSTMPPWLVFDLDAIKQQFDTDGHPLNEAGRGMQDAILGRSPRRYRDFVQETAKLWLDEAS
ncbi:SDR family oxidoreductase [Bauldia sp.]|uniref:SDR family oxidoreductase n=1 Tax=Bauldia sp. TaxID=2575872 RepID=UPI003BA90B27